MEIKSISVFIAYAHEDEPLLKELEKHLAGLRNQGLITAWHDRNISAGAEWEHQINVHLNTAQIILLLISANFLASPYCYNIEMRRALERHELGEARVIPIILRPSDWKNALFGKLQALPRNGKPITSRGRRDGRDQAFLEVISGIREAIQNINEQPVEQNHGNYHTSLYSKKQSSSEPTSDSVNGSDRVKAEYICYLSNDKLAALFAQVDTKTLENYGTSYRSIMSLSFGEAADRPDNERKRRIIVSQLSLVLDYLERTARIGELAEILRENGQLNCDWYHLQAVFRAEPWKVSDYQVFLFGKIEDYHLRLSCSKSNFPGLSREGDTYIPTSTNAFLFNGDVGLYLRGLVRLINVDHKAKAISGTPLYLVLSTDLARLQDAGLPPLADS